MLFSTYRATVTTSSPFEARAVLSVLLGDLGALAELESAVLAHCEEYRPNPPYRPQLVKKRLAPDGWLPEVRVPPYDPAQDEVLTVNERYDLSSSSTPNTDESGWPSRWTTGRCTATSSSSGAA